MSKERRPDKYPWAVGMEVTVVARQRANSIRKVTRLTPTLVVTGEPPREWAFRRDDGYDRARRGYEMWHIVPTTDEHRQTIRQRALAVQLRDCSWASLPLPVLEQVWALVRRAEIAKWLEEVDE